MSDRRDDLARIERALAAAAALLASFSPERVAIDRKRGGEPVTEADRAADALLRESLLEPGEGWLSEETEDDPSRLARRRVWVVDPVDGTREFLDGVPEWCVSIALVEDGRPVAGGTANPATGETFLGAEGLGATRNGKTVAVTPRDRADGATVLASRSEVRRGEWRRFEGGPIVIRPTGSVAYKLSLVAAGLADATWSLVPKHEWDVAAGAALVLAAGGVLEPFGGEALRFNARRPVVPGLIACGPRLVGPLRRLVDSTPGGAGPATDP